MRLSLVMTCPATASEQRFRLQSTQRQRRSLQTRRLKAAIGFEAACICTGLV